MKRTLKQRILDEMIISDEFAFDITKQLYFSGRLKPEYEGLSFDELYDEVKVLIKKLEKAKKRSVM